MILPSTMEASILQFASCFTQPTFQTFGVIVAGWLLAHGRRVVHAAGPVIRLREGQGQRRGLDAGDVHGVRRRTTAANWPSATARVAASISGAR